VDYGVVMMVMLLHRATINVPTKRGKEKSPSDGHCQCEKEMDDHILASLQFFWNVWLLSLLFYSVSGNAYPLIETVKWQSTEDNDLKLRFLLKYASNHRSELIIFHLFLRRWRGIYYIDAYNVKGLKSWLFKRPEKLKCKKNWT
jgi:hypothetical protein